MPIQDTDALYYNDLADIEDLGYNNFDKHNKELQQQPINNAYHLPLEPDTEFKRDILPTKPTDAAFTYPDNKINDESVSTWPTVPLDQASASSMDNRYQICSGANITITTGGT